MNFIINMIEKTCGFLWGDLVTLPLTGGSTLGLPLLVILLIPTGIYFSVNPVTFIACNL